MTKNRLKHSHGVAKKMRKLALDHSKHFKYSAEELFLLGLLHDIGYALTENTKEHAEVGGLFLKEEGFPLWEETYYHGLIQDDYSSNELALLNFCDMTISSDGTEVTIEERIEDIASRYGKDSPHVQTALNMKAWIEKSCSFLFDDM